MFLNREEFRKSMDTTKVKVLQGDIPTGLYIFNGHSLVRAPEEKRENKDEPLMHIELAQKVRVYPKQAEERHPIVQVGTNLVPLYTTIGGFLLTKSLPGALLGFAAGNMLTRNQATFECVLSDGRAFQAMAEYNVFKRIMDIAIKTDSW